MLNLYGLKHCPCRLLYCLSALLWGCVSWPGDFRNAYLLLLSSFPQDPDSTTTTQTFGPVFSIKPSFMKFRVSLGTSLIKNVKKRLRLVLLTYYKMIKELSDIKRKTAIRNCMIPDVPVLVQVFQVIKDHWFLDNTLNQSPSPPRHSLRGRPPVGSGTWPLW